MNRITSMLTLTAALAGLAPALLGQPTERNTAELYGFGGVTNLRSAGDGDTKGTFGGGAFFSTSRHLSVGGEYSRIPLGSASLLGIGDVPGTTVTSSASGHINSLQGGVRINLGGGPKANFYVPAMFGAARLSVHGTATARSGNQVVTVNLNESDTKALLATGLGVRLYASKHWGIEPEFRYSRIFADPGVHLIQFTAGVFYQFGN